MIQKGMQYFIIILIFSYFSGLGFAEEIHVPTGGMIQAAIDASNEGDEVIVPEGIYNEALLFPGHDITLRGAGPGLSILDGTGLNESIIQMLGGEGPETLVEGFTLQNGEGHIQPPTGSLYGGAILLWPANPTLRNLVFRNNLDEMSPGVNTHGGAVYSNNPHPNPLKTLHIENCKFINNGFYTEGGAIKVFRISLDIAYSIFDGNHAHQNFGYGGALSGSIANLTIINSLFTNNFARGGGAFRYEAAYDPSDPDGIHEIKIINTSFLNNSAYLRNGVFSIRNTITEFISVRMFLRNNIYWGNFLTQDDPLQPPPVFPVGSLNHHDYELLDGQYNLSQYQEPSTGGSGRWLLEEDNNLIDIDPLLEEDHHLTPASPVRNFGFNDAIDGFDTDLDGAERIEEEIVDLGPYEFQDSDPGEDCIGDVDDSGDVGFSDLLAILALWEQTCVGCSEDIDESGAIDFPDLVFVLSAWGECT